MTLARTQDMRRPRWLVWAALPVSLVTMSCALAHRGPDGEVDVSVLDQGFEDRGDVGTPDVQDGGGLDVVDTGMDVPRDTGTPDTGFDAGMDVPRDTGMPDTGFDAGMDVPRDMGTPDTGFDAGPPDMGPPDTGPADTGPADTGPPCGMSGQPCCASNTCNSGLACHTPMGLPALCMPCGEPAQPCCPGAVPCNLALAALGLSCQSKNSFGNACVYSTSTTDATGTQCRNSGDCMQQDRCRNFGSGQGHCFPVGGLYQSCDGNDNCPNGRTCETSNSLFLCR